jgi:hypothetical protein
MRTNKSNVKNKTVPDWEIDWKRNIYKPINSDSIGSYKNKLTLNEINKIEFVCGEILEVFNYDCNHDLAKIPFYEVIYVKILRSKFYRNLRNLLRKGTIYDDLYCPKINK